MKARVKNRNRYDVKFFFPDGASMRWTSNPTRSLTRQEVVAGLLDVISTLQEPAGQTLTVGAVARPDGSATGDDRA